MRHKSLCVGQSRTTFIHDSGHPMESQKWVLGCFLSPPSGFFLLPGSMCSRSWLALFFGVGRWLVLVAEPVWELVAEPSRRSGVGGLLENWMLAPLVCELQMLSWLSSAVVFLLHPHGPAPSSSESSFYGLSPVLDSRPSGSSLPRVLLSLSSSILLLPSSSSLGSSTSPSNLCMS